MATTITMPQLGETVTEGTVSQWLKREGDRIEKYEAFVEVSTDKVNAEVPSPVSGVIAKIIAQAGETVAIGAPIATIEEHAVVPVAAAAPQNVPNGSNGTHVSNGARGAGDSNGASRPTAVSGSDSVAFSNAAGQRVSPAVRRLARERGIDPAQLAGSGAGGRVTADDVVAASSAQGTVSDESVPEKSAAGDIASLVATSTGSSPLADFVAPPAALGLAIAGTLLPLTPMRRLIAQRMVESVTMAPHAWTMVEVDVSDLWAWRSREKEAFLRQYDTPLTLLHFFIHAVVQELRRHPLLNATFADEGITLHSDINIGVAVGFDDTLVVPVIRAAQTYSISGIARAAGSLIERARRGTLDADDLAGGTFTVNNTGANGSILSAPILHGGQSAIVTMEAVVKRPIVVAGDAIAIRSMMNVCLSLDHRVLDGTSASGFLRDLKKRLEGMGPAGDL